MKIPFLLPEEVIFLCGLPGSGKTTIAKRIAVTTQRPFFDLDQMIEEDLGMSIEEIFATQGEAFFRSKETAILESYIFPQKAIVALGGGTPCFNNNMALLKQKGLVIYLKADIDVLAKRLLKHTTQRPLLKGKDFNQLKNYLTEIFNQRETYYKQADKVWLDACL
jgi:shikimate kinase